MTKFKDLARRLAEREEFRQKNKLLFMELYRPEPRKPKELRFTKMQTKMLLCTRADDPGQLPHRMIIRGSNKQGKTAGVVIRAICFACGKQPFLPPDHPLYDLTKFVPVPCGILVMGEELVQAVKYKLIPEFKKWLPDICKYRTYRNPQGVETEITIQTGFEGEPIGSRIFFRAYGQIPRTFEGVDSHVNLFDEPPPQDIYTPVQRGLVATEGYSMIAMTHVNEPWLRPLEKESIDMGGPDKDFRVIKTGSIWENLVEKGGFLTKSAIERFIKEVKATEPHNYGPRILGDSMLTGQTIFGMFRDEPPFVVPDFEIPRHWTWWEGVDPADTKDTIWVFVAVSPYDITINGQRAYRCFVVDYFRFPPRDSITDIADAVKKRRLELGYEKPYAIVLDRKHGRRIQKAEKHTDRRTWEEMLTNVGIGYIELADQKSGDVETGQKIIKEYLKPQFWKLEDRDVPGLVFLNRCHSRGAGPGPIEAMENYRCKRGSNEPMDDENKDVVDALRYVMMKIPSYVDPAFRVREEYVPVSKHTGH